MHKDKMVGKFELFQDKPYRFTELYNIDELPIGIKGDKDFANDNLMSWHSRRVIPQGRLNLSEIKKALVNKGSIEKVALSSMGLSLNDTYWYKPEDSILTWNDVNFRDNEFNESLFELESIGKIINPTMSPDFRTNGALKKMWIIEDDKPCLIKSGEYDGITNGSGILAANEVVASKIANLFDLEAVEYSLLSIEGLQEKFCISECFVKRDEDFVSGRDLMDQFDTRNNKEVYDFIYKSCDFSKDMDKLITIDVLLHNQDRHEDNFGIILDANTNNIKRFAPMYDTGNILAWNGVLEQDNMKFPKINRQDCMTKVQSKILLPSIGEIKDVIQDVYNRFNVPEKQYELAIKDMEQGYNIIQEFNHNPQLGLGFDINSLFEEER